MAASFAQQALGAGRVHGPGWQPRWSMIEARGGLLTAAERAEVARRLIAIEALFLKADASGSRLVESAPHRFQSNLHRRFFSSQRANAHAIWVVLRIFRRLLFVGIHKPDALNPD